MSRDIAAIRQDYTLASLDASDLDDDPVAQFGRWFNEALESECMEPNAMTLTTLGAEGEPRSRIVLLKGVDARGLVFYTNYRSDKGEDIARDPRVSLTFFWAELQRQVRVEGRAEQVPSEESDRYFASRPRGSRISAWASAQSQPVPDRATLEARFDAAQERFAEGDVPRPPHWGGYVVQASRWEFWQGRASRLHDRLVYMPDGEGWRIERRMP